MAEQLTVGSGDVYVKPPGKSALVPPGAVTERATFPAACAGVANVSHVEELTVTDPEGMVVVSTVTVVSPETKFVPITVTVVPPAIDPELGEIELTVGIFTEQVILTVTFPVMPFPEAFAIEQVSPTGWVATINW